VVGYLTYVADAGATPSTLRQKLAAISYVHKIKKHPLPSQFVEVKTLMEGITRAKAHKPRQRKPLLLDGLRKMVNAIDAPDPVNVRDRAILLVAYFGLLRRSELVSLLVEQVTFERDDAGMMIRLAKSKTDQQEEGANLPYPRLDEANTDVCPVRALRDWLTVLRDEYGVTKGAIFRRINQWGQMGERALSGQVVNMLVKRYALKAGIIMAGDAEFDISAHSALRAGMATQLDKEQQPFSIIKKAGRWKSDSVARGYIRRDEDDLREALKRAASS
jgi:integrase